MTRPQHFFWDHSIIFYPHNGPFFPGGGSLSEICGQNLRNVGRTAVVIIICYQYSLNIKTTAHIFEILTTFFRKAFLEILNRLGELLYCTVMPLVKSLFQREEETAAQLIQYLNNEIPSCVTIKMTCQN